MDWSSIVVIGFLAFVSTIDCENNPISWRSVSLLPSVLLFPNEEQHWNKLKQASSLLQYPTKTCPRNEISHNDEEPENILTEGWVNANILNFTQHYRPKLKNTGFLKNNLHVALDLKFLLASTAEQQDSSSRISSLNVWLTLLIVAVAAAILS